VTRSCSIGSWIRSAPWVATTSGSGGPEGKSRFAGAGAVYATLVAPFGPNAVTSKVMTPIAATTDKLAKRRNRCAERR
jgi:hypothetical protein